MATQRSPARSWPVTLAVIGFALQTACAAAPVADDAPARISAEASGRDTATQAADAARSARPDDAANDSPTTRWIYATNMSDGEPSSARADGRSAASESSASATPTGAESTRAHRSPPVKLMLGADGSIQAPHTRFDTPVAAANWAQTSLSTTDTDTVELYAARGTDASSLDALLAALRNADVPQIAIVFAPAPPSMVDDVDDDGADDSSDEQPEDSQ